MILGASCCHLELGCVDDLLGEEAFAAAWEAGRAMPLEQAVAFALEEAETDG